MRFFANRSELLPIIRRMCLTIGRRFESMEGACVYMDAADNHVTFIARGTNCSLQIRHSCRVEEPGTALLHANVFQLILEHAKEEPTEVATQDKLISVRNAKSVYSFALIPTKGFLLPEPLQPAALLEADGLPELSAKVLFSVANGSSAQPQFQCVHVTCHDGSFRASSCDGVRLTIARKNAAQDAPLDMLLPEAAMKTMLAVFRGIPHCKIGMQGNAALFLGPGMIFSAQTSSCTAPPLQMVIGRISPVCTLKVDGSRLFAEVKRLGIGNTSGAKVIIQQKDVDTLIARYLCRTSGVAAETEIPVKTEIAPLQKKLCYAYPYLREAAALAQGQAVSLSFDQRGYMLLETEREMHVLLSMRLPEETELQKPKKKTKKNAA